ncbi:MmcQ/YjbR family DNA-binding protein [Streptomyces gardneri]|uniref:MmcQ/YjbR family DNA-binding protein n=1 Tax=Nocardia TaxID=1817 RepID=UPI001359E1FF|nr:MULTISPECIES: MmcQ/YjbR family DNA-binding protein [Nocardia]MBF6167518.1 MmcQ/YjbR family DNA-binding protein [Streptomyces gardneri]MBF6206293.1 MmcQ/YjbR family DNA-binding protein [Streptomyces gardneri]
MTMTWQDVVTMATELPEVEESTWWRSPALKVGGKGFARLRSEAEGGLALACDLTEKEALLASGDPAFYTTPHYDGYAYILVDLDRVAPDHLRELLDAAWWLTAAAKLRKQRERETR